MKSRIYILLVIIFASCTATIKTTEIDGWVFERHGNFYLVCDEYGYNCRLWEKTIDDSLYIGDYLKIETIEKVRKR